MGFFFLSSTIYFRNFFFFLLFPFLSTPPIYGLWRTNSNPWMGLMLLSKLHLYCPRGKVDSLLLAYLWHVGVTEPGVLPCKCGSSHGSVTFLQSVFCQVSLAGSPSLLPVPFPAPPGVGSRQVVLMDVQWFPSPSPLPSPASWVSLALHFSPACCKPPKTPQTSVVWSCSLCESWGAAGGWGMCCWGSLEVEVLWAV